MLRFCNFLANAQILTDVEILDDLDASQDCHTDMQHKKTGLLKVLNDKCGLHTFLYLLNIMNMNIVIISISNVNPGIFGKTGLSKTTCISLGMFHE